MAELGGGQTARGFGGQAGGAHRSGWLLLRDGGPASAAELQRRGIPAGPGSSGRPSPPADDPAHGGGRGSTGRPGSGAQPGGDPLGEGTGREQAEVPGEAVPGAQGPPPGGPGARSTADSALRGRHRPEPWDRAETSVPPPGQDLQGPAGGARERGGAAAGDRRLPEVRRCVGL